MIGDIVKVKDQEGEFTILSISNDRSRVKLNSKLYYPMSDLRLIRHSPICRLKLLNFPEKLFAKAIVLSPRELLNSDRSYPHDDQAFMKDVRRKLSPSIKKRILNFFNEAYYNAVIKEN